MKKDDEISTLMTISSPNYVFLQPDPIAPSTISSVSSETTWQLTKSCEELYKKGGNVFFQVVEKLGGGKIILHTVGLVRIKHEWHLEHTQEEIQFYALESDSYFTPSFQDLGMFHTLLDVVENDENIPSISEYEEIIHPDGTIVSFNPFTHVGVIKTSLGLAMFHRNDVRRDSSTCVKPGTKVDFTLIAQEGMSFPYKAIEVGYPHEVL
ncbi:MAG: hypothetical protein UX21_C0011G0011 [Microgenomates group bacterium GW2011_GWC2_45_8]|nr:MAG: hypothetical protein UX21_C0011G0011 [Microgenomates group bacterium GW2011_GWC2_45_8]